MILWLALGWLGLGAATAAGFHWLRRYRPVSVPPEVRSFLRRLEEIVRAYHPDVAIRGMLPGRFAVVLAVQGQEVPVPLHHIFRHACAFPAAMPQMVETLLREIAAGGLTRIGEHRFEDVATRILPQVRAATWVTARSPAFGDAGLVSRALADDVRVCYVIDDVGSMVFVCRAHLRQWGIDEESLHRLAVQNLRRIGGERLPVPGPQDAPLVLHTGDGYDAARVLLLDAEQAEGLLLAMPERDTLWLSRAGDAGLSTLMALNREQNAASAYPVSPTIYRYHDGKLERLSDAAQS